MRSERFIGSTLLAGACLLLGVVSASAAERPELVRVTAVEEADSDDAFVPGPPRGIRSHGRGPAWIARPGSLDAELVPGDDPPVSAAVAGTSFKLSGAMMETESDAVGFTISPDGERAVYLADQETAGRVELYSVPVDGSAAPTKLSAGIPFGLGDQGVSFFNITPDSANVVFLADPTFGNGTGELYSAPIDGSAAPTQLSSASQAPVTGVGVLPNSQSVVFFGVFSGALELFKATINVPGSIRLSEASAGNPSGNVVAATFSPDSSRVVFAADGGTDDVFQWYGVPTAAAGPGQEVQLSAAQSFVSLAAVSPDSSKLVYTADEAASGVWEIFSVPIEGGSSMRLNPSMAGSGVSSIYFGNDSQRVAYLADQNMPGVTEAFVAAVSTPGSGARLNDPINTPQSVRSIAFSPDGTIAVYEADEDTPDNIDVLSAPAAGGGPSTVLHDVDPPDNAALFAGLGTPIVGARAVYPVVGPEVNVFSVPIDGTGSFVRINDPLTTGDSIFNAFVPSSATRLMAYGTGPVAEGITTRVVVAPIRADLVSEQINVTSPVERLGVQAFEVSSQEDFAVYLQDQDTDGQLELYGFPLDSDGDTVPNSTDNCKFIPNPAQEEFLFVSTVLASSDTTFGWSGPADVRFVRGPLSGVSGLVTDDSGSLAEASSYRDDEVPATAGAGFYFLFALDCPGGSFQTAFGEEPARDTLLP